MLEDEFKKIWKWNSKSKWQSGDAQKDYQIALLKSVGMEDPATDFHAQECEQTANLISERLLEALSSPRLYIRELGKILLEERQRWSRE